MDNKLVICLFFATILILSLSVPQSFAQNNSNNNNFVLATTIEVTNIGMELTKESLQKNDYDSAEKYSKFTNDFFGKKVNELRSVDANLADKIHLSLLDIHADITSEKNNDPIISSINNIQDSLPVNDISKDAKDQMIVSLLSEADQQYQKFEQQNDST
ncbi:MAG: hypothetical protein GWN01_01065, partial [Nitrosopumilaceae archaeon]|nr:hypothetical protein [Nitrosopumilaceae archaeon]NIU88717.1 hypothetical protein [Nitrosopumilaceae archaeon]NIV64768.1 hypothetical protein [Nitrosopumilaceae archaeon]NIX60170.1 hypothetical protein [Nitrosopumilaceae archaeon]